MSVTVDARGLSCPQPVLMTMNEIKGGSEKEIKVLVDSEASRENVSRAAVSQGCQIVDTTQDGEEYTILLTRD